MSKPRTLFKEAFNRTLDLLAGAQVLPSESELAGRLDVSRTTVRAVLNRMQEIGLIRWDRELKVVLRPPQASDAYPPGETDSLDAIIERGFMRRILAGGAEPGDMIGEADLARDLGVGVSAVREFLIRFS
ncbi:MAG: GntR family transcriptional regulator, partial [Methylobacterium sp.]